MQTVQVVLFVVVAALALPLVAYLVIPRLRSARRPSPVRAAEPPARVPPPLELVCPTCRREYPAGLKFCPADARALVATMHATSSGPTPAPDPVAAGPGLAGPVCRRSFDGSKKFCPYDAEELTPSVLPAIRRAKVGPPGLAHVLGKICPHCAKRYESEATFCGRDGAELVSIN